MIMVPGFVKITKLFCSSSFFLFMKMYYTKLVGVKNFIIIYLNNDLFSGVCSVL